MGATGNPAGAAWMPSQTYDDSGMKKDPSQVTIIGFTSVSAQKQVKGSQEKPETLMAPFQEIETVDPLNNSAKKPNESSCVYISPISHNGNN